MQLHIVRIDTNQQPRLHPTHLLIDYRMFCLHERIQSANQIYVPPFPPSSRLSGEKSEKLTMPNHSFNIQTIVRLWLCNIDTPTLRTSDKDTPFSDMLLGNAVRPKYTR